jgi:hypothetical protein
VVPVPRVVTAPVPPPAYHRAVGRRGPDLQIDALRLVTAFHLLALCQVIATAARRQSPPALPKGPGGAPVVYADGSLLLLALLRTLWRLSYQDMHDWLVSWPALARACGLPTDVQGRPRVPSASQQWKRLARAGAPPCELLFVTLVKAAIRRRLVGARDRIIDSAPIKAWRKDDPDAALGHAPAHHPTRLLRGFRVHTLLCRGSGLPLLFLLWPANAHDAPFARRLLALAVQLYAIRPRFVRLDAAYWGPALIRWIHTSLGAVAVIPWNPKRTKNRSCLPPTWTLQELGKRSSIERFFGRVFCFFRLQRPPLTGWSAVASGVALTYAGVVLVALAADAGRPDPIRSPKRVLAHTWEGLA